MSILVSPVAISIRFVVVSLVALSGASVCIAYVVTRQRRKAKRPIYAISALLMILGAITYIYGFYNDTSVFIRAGWATAILSVLLIVVIIANTLADWKREK